MGDGGEHSPPGAPASDAVLRLAASRLEASFDDVLEARISRAAFQAVEPYLDRLGQDAALLRVWQVDHVLAACRRALNTSGADDVSIVAGLTKLRNCCGWLTPHHVVEYAVHELGQLRQEGLTAHVLWLVELLRVDVGLPPVGLDEPIEQATVQSDLSTLRTIGDRVKDLATRTVAHRLDRDGETVSADEIDRLLDQLSAVYRRWSPLLRFTDVDTGIDHLVAGKRLQSAVATYDHEGLTRARVEAARRAGHNAPTWWMDLDSVEVSYRVSPTRST